MAMATNYSDWSTSDSYSSSYSDSSSGDDNGFTTSPRSSGKLDYSYQELDSDLLEANLQDLDEDEGSPSKLPRIQRILLFNNNITFIPPTLTKLQNVTHIDLSNNGIRTIPKSICQLKSLTHLYLRNNLLNDDSFPKDLGTLIVTLRDLNVSGNQFTTIPNPILSMRGLRNLFIGGNRITHVPNSIGRMNRLRVLYVGGNFLKRVPLEINQLRHLVALVLADNQIETLPDSICDLRKLQCLQLHKNKLTTLPNNLIHLKCLRELSLRDNPLVVRFVREMTHQPSTLMELAARVVKVNKVAFEEWELPVEIRDFLESSHECVNPKCQGVYFNSRVEHVKFVDFCGKYKVPLMQYLCSSRCKTDRPAYVNKMPPDVESSKMKRVLLG